MKEHWGRKGKKNSKKEKAERLRNKKLVKKYYFLKPVPWYKPKRNRRLPKYDYSYIEWYGWPNGWNVAFADMFLEELGAEIKQIGQKDFQIDQIKEKYGCYDNKTEVLTKDGWKFFKDLSYEDEIATLNPILGYLEYEHPYDIIAAHYNGKMYRLENRGISLCVTPNHNLYVAKGSGYTGVKGNFQKRTYDFELCTPDKYFGVDKRFKKTCKWEGRLKSVVYKIKGIEYDSVFNKKDENSKIRHYIHNELSFDIIPWLRFLGFYIAEGCVSIRQDSKHHNMINVSFNPYDELELVQDLIHNIGFTPAIDTKRGAACFCNPTLGEWLFKNCGHMAYNKKVPDFIKQLPSEYIKEFLEYLFIGDGHKTKTYNILTTTSKQLSDDVQELLLKAGYSFREKIRDRRGPHGFIDKHEVITKHIQYDINWLQLPDIEIDMTKARKNQKFQEEWIDYNGCVYCVSVPNHIIYIRRNGKGIWCGNSLRCYTSGTSEKANQIIDKYSHISENICWDCGKPDVPMIDDGWVHPVCLECFIKAERKRDEFHKESHPEYILPTDDEYALKYQKFIVDKPNENGEYKVAKSYMIRHWKDDKIIDVKYDISDTVDKIYERWERRKINYEKRKVKRNAANHGTA